jgi:predicted GIY-YIG superfamily endonuclease
MSWVLYILECADKTLYTGITNDLERRLAAHKNGTGAKYLRGRGPLVLIHTEAHPDRAAASRREAAVKRLKPEEKRALAAAAPSRKRHKKAP